MRALSTITVWNANTGTVFAGLIEEFDTVKSVAFSPDGKSFVSDSARQAVHVWGTTTLDTLAIFEGHEYYRQVSCAVFSPDGRNVATHVINPVQLPQFHSGYREVHADQTLIHNRDQPLIVATYICRGSRD
jgi:uncharacterized protein with WD repeat